MTSPIQVVQKQFDAYNNHDLEAFVATYHPKVVLYTFPDNEVMLEGHDALRVRYTERFAPGSNIHGVLLNRIAWGSYVTDLERISGLKDGENVEALVTYQVEKGLITKVWFNMG